MIVFFALPTENAVISNTDDHYRYLLNNNLQLRLAADGTIISHQVFPT
jgi:hypothetical protein